MRENYAKYLSYAEAWARINSAIDAGYYFEAVTLCESIISDRLLSYVRGTDKLNKADIKTPFAKLIADWRKITKGNLPDYGASDLGAAIDKWRVERNEVVHGLTKSNPGLPPPPVASFLERAKTAAVDGKKLAKAISKWHKNQLKAYRT